MIDLSETVRRPQCLLSDCKRCVLQIFKMWNRELYVREQQDAYEFFTSLVDQLDEYLKVKDRAMTKKQLSMNDDEIHDVSFPIENGSRTDLQKHLSGNLL